MQMDPAMLTAYFAQAFDSMDAVLDRMGAAQLNTRPFGDGTNSISALVMHSTEVTEFWLGHVGLGRPTERQRELEFSHEADDAELRERIARARAAAETYVSRLEAGEGQASPVRQTLTGDESDGSIIVHVLEELFQHLGHMDITADALGAPPTPEE